MKQPNLEPNDTPNSTRKPYSRPEISQVKLVAEEAVLAAGCKTAFTDPAGGVAIGCAASVCVDDGT